MTRQISLAVFAVSSLLFSCVTGNILIVTDGNYSLGPADNDYWLKSGPFFLYQNGHRLDTDTRTLKMAPATYARSGLDKLGNWQENVWVLTDRRNNTLMEAAIRTYPIDEANIVIFIQRFPNGLKNSRSDSRDHTITGFPSFRLDSDVTNTSLAYLMFAGIMMGDTGKRHGRWVPPTTKLPGGIDGSGPLVLYDHSGNVLIASFMDNSMAASVWQDRDVLAWGVMGGVDSLPAGFSLRTLFYLGNSGVGSAFQEWGRVLRSWYDKTDDVVKYHQAQDLTLTHLGYWTDNGAYYYYVTEANKTYEQTLPDVLQYATGLHIPYRYVQIDSWWYPKDQLGGVTTWDAMPTIFPHGLRNFSRTLQLPIAAHNRYWSSNTTYAKQNRGMFDFYVEQNMSLPMSFEFWDWLFQTSSQWGLRLYEQDWLNVQTLGMDVLQTSTTAGSDWLDRMALAARTHNLTIQYCMAQSRHGLHSLRSPEVTQARVTTDYHLAPDQWKMGVTSHFAAAVGLAPSKDTFWTSSVEKDNRYNKIEPYPELQSAVATLSTGPVGPGDAINGTNVANLMRCCAADGLILKPSKPATAIDAQFLEMGFGEGRGTSGEVWSTHTQLSDFLIFGILLTFNVTRPFNVTPTAAGFGRMVPQFPDSKIFVRGSPGQARPFSDRASLDIGPGTCNTSTAPHFCLFYTSPVFRLSGNEVVLLGELDKWVPISDRRVLTITHTPLTLTLTLRGQPDERIGFSYLVNGVLMDTIVTPDAAGCAIVVIAPTPSTTAPPTTHPSTPPSTHHTDESSSGEVTTGSGHSDVTTTQHRPTSQASHGHSDVTTTQHRLTSQASHGHSDATTTQHRPSSEASHATETTEKAADAAGFERVFTSSFAATNSSCQFQPPPFTPPLPTSPASVTSEVTSTSVTPTKPTGGAGALKSSRAVDVVLLVVQMCLVAFLRQSCQC